MIYKFKSPAAGDLIMLEAHGNQLLQLLGREPAAKGIFEVADMPGCVAALQAAVAAEAAPAPRADDETKPVPGLRQRLWPMLDMLRRCHVAGEPIVWGV